MNTAKLIATLLLGIMLLGGVAAEGYFYSYSQRQNTTADSVAKSIQDELKTKPLSDELALAKKNLELQTQKLDAMKNSFPDSPYLDADIKADVSNAAGAAEKDDALVADPKLHLSTQANIVALGQKATDALSYLQTLINHHASTVVLDDAAHNAVDLVSAYTNEISKYVGSISPGDAGLTPSQVASYESQVKEITLQVDSAENSLKQVDSVPAGDQAAVNGNDQNPANDQNQGQGSSGSGANASGNGASSQGAASADNPPAPENPSGSGQNPDQAGASQAGSVTLGDIANQQNVVTDANDQVQELADQGAPSASSSPSGATDNSGSDVSNPSFPSDGGQDQSSMGTGTVRLIQAENNF